MARWRKASTATCAPPGITTAEVKGPLQQEKDWSKSLFFPPSREPTRQEQKIILALVVEQGIIACMENVCYLFNREVKQQEDGLATGEDAARAMARVVMLDWDMEVTRLARDNELELLLHSRYVDDTADAGQALAPGHRWEESRIIFRPELVEEDMSTPEDCPVRPG